MCIIYTSDNPTSRPSLAELDLGYSRNSDGVGVAWMQDNRLHFKKALKWRAGDLHDFVKTLPAQVLIHLRFTSVGETSDEMCHPYPVTTSGALLSATEGRPESLLMHNGTLEGFDWRALLLTTPLDKLPPGPWNDSKALAYAIASHKNERLLDMHEEDSKFVIMRADGSQTFWGYWHKVRHGLWTSQSLEALRPKYTAPVTGWAKGGVTVTPAPEKSMYEMTDEEFRAYMDNDGLDADWPIGAEVWTDAQWDAWEQGVPPSTVEMMQTA